MDNSITTPVLFQSKDECCGCGACMNVCPKQAINMREDDFGFWYPQINTSLCIGCERCKQVCAFHNIKAVNQVVKVYAAVTKDRDIITQSASGGIFATLANIWVNSEGIAYGAAFDSEWGAHHVQAANRKEICKLQGSKYTQSNTEYTFLEVKQLLLQGRKVLYSGTPCQIAGLYSFLGKQHNNLVTIDIVCHGVPSNRMFQEYLKLIEEREKGNILNFTFRDKSKGWGINGKAQIASGKKNKSVTVWNSESSYLFYFSKGWIYRESCYSCPYTNSHRPADLTIGDYWGIEKAHPEYLGKDGFKESEGISLILVNTKKGQEFLDHNKEFLELRNSDFIKVSSENLQLRKPCEKGKGNEILALYLKGGWRAVDERFHKNIGWKKYSSRIKAMLPLGLKRILKKRMAMKNCS